MANPQTENGHTSISDELLDAIIAIRLSGEESQCFWLIVRKTYGWKKKEDWISLSQFVKATGINKGNVGRALRKLLAKNMVVKKDYRYGVSYGIQKNYKKWKPLSKKTTGSQKRLKVSSKKTTTIETITKEKRLMPLFNNFWQVYPKRNNRKVGKAECLELVKKLKEDDYDVLLRATTNYANSGEARDNYARDPIRFLRKEFWRDWAETETKSKRGAVV